MIKKTILLLLTFFSLAIHLYGQELTFEAGAIILKDGTKKEMLLQENVIQKLCKGVVTKQSKNSEEQFFSQEKIIGYEFNKGNRKYRLVEIEVIDLLSTDFSRKKIKKFGQVLTEGTVELVRVFLSTDEYKKEVIGSESYLYLITKENQKYQLDLLSFTTKGIHSTVSKRYRAVLKYIFETCKEAQSMTQRLGFKDSQMLKIIKAYEQCSNKSIKYLITEEGSSKAIINHHLGVGYLKIIDDNFSNERSFIVNYLTELRFPKLSRRLGLTINLAYVNHSFNWIYSSNVENQSMIKLKTTINSYLVQQGDFSLQFGVGVSTYNAFKSTIEFSIANGYFLADLGLFAKYKKFLITTSYQLGGTQFKPKKIIDLSLYYQL